MPFSALGTPVQGSRDAGEPCSGEFPVQVAGCDPGGLVQPLKVDGSGGLLVSPSAGGPASKVEGKSPAGTDVSTINPILPGGGDTFNNLRPLRVTDAGRLRVALSPDFSNIVAGVNLPAEPDTGSISLFVSAVNSVWGGSAWGWLRTPTVFKAQNAVAIAAETAIWTPAGGKKFRYMGGQIACSVTGNVILRDGLAGAIIDVIACIAGTTVTLPTLGNGILSAAANNALTAQGPAASTLSGKVFGTEE